MQLQCSVLVNPLTLAMSDLRQRYSRGILVLRYSKVKEIGKYELVLTTSRNRNGRIFHISRDNIRRIHSTKMQWGSVTIEMNYPSVLICIKEASVPSLHRFISKLRDILAGKDVVLDKNTKITSSGLALLRKKLILTSRKQYTENKLGFPSYLRELIISNIGLTTVDSRWFGATSLYRLDLSGNRLGNSDTFKTKFLNIVRLQHLKILVLAGNEITCIPDHLWNALPENLLSLDLSNNQISYLSSCCTRFPQMTHLLLSHNRIEELPRTVCFTDHTINNLKTLQCLDISWNKIKFLPSEIKDLSLELLDVTAHSGEEEPEVQVILDQLLQTTKPSVNIASLFEYAAAAVLNYSEQLTVVNANPMGVTDFILLVLSDQRLMLNESSSTVEDAGEIWKNKIRNIELLLCEADAHFQDTEGIGKFKKKLKTEMKFLISLEGLPSSELKRYLDTSNITHLQSLLNVAKRYSSCCAFYKSFVVPQRKAKREVDLVVNSGATWVKVISRNVRGLAMDSIGAGGNASRSTIEQAHDYIQMARLYPHFFEVPKIIFEFVYGVPDLLQRKLESLGIEVIGTKVNINELVKLPVDFALNDTYDNINDIYDSNDPYFSTNECLKVEDSVVDTINLDISAVFALVSSLTHGNGANYNYTSQLLNAQAALERKKPTLPPLLKAIQGRKLIICRTAYDAVQSILSTVAGSEEKIRAKELFQKVKVVEDKMTERAARLNLSDKINQRSKIIFGSGDYYRAVTVTANRHFVRAAAHQSIHFAVIIHESRALSEQKQQDLQY
uniref:DUF1308 domain-containing protein n=1 Tax=Setaria digitata TaxID=48799 RepID=A0A915PV94_9BILA